MAKLIDANNVQPFILSAHHNSVTAAHAHQAQVTALESDFSNVSSNPLNPATATVAPSVPSLLGIPKHHTTCVQQAPAKYQHCR